MSKRTGLGLTGVVLFLAGALAGQWSSALHAQPGAAVALKDAKWSHAFNLQVRGGGERTFTKDTKKIGVEVFRDENNGNWIYISETGAIAVVSGPAAK
jgi:hypothetical protein